MDVNAWRDWRQQYLISECGQGLACRIRYRCCQFLHAFTSRYDSTLLGCISFYTKVFLHAINMYISASSSRILLYPQVQCSCAAKPKKFLFWVKNILYSFPIFQGTSTTQKLSTYLAIVFIVWLTNLCFSQATYIDFNN